MTETRTIAVCCSGGDVPGMNPWLRAVVRLGLNCHAAIVLGIKDGYAGLVRTAERIARGEQSLAALEEMIDVCAGRAALDRRGQDLVRLDQAAVSGLCRRGGAILGAGRCLAFHDLAVRQSVADLLRILGVHALMICGGNGSLAGAACLARESDLQIIGVPATIDNDVCVNEMALGVDTAVNGVVWAVERFADTASSHHRIMVLETMGRDSGNLARLAALAAGAELVVTPERGPLTVAKMQGIAFRMENSLIRGRNRGIVLVAEGVKLELPAGSPAVALAAYLEEHFRRPGSPFTELETRASVLGHLQRGGSPTAADRILAARFAQAAWDAVLADGTPNGMVGLRQGKVVFQPFDDPARGDLAEPLGRLYYLQKSLRKW